MVQEIINSRPGNKKKGGVEYLVKWQGYAASENTWEPAENLENCPQKLEKFNKSQKSESGATVHAKSETTIKGKGKGKSK